MVGDVFMVVKNKLGVVRDRYGNIFGQVFNDNYLQCIWQYNMGGVINLGFNVDRVGPVMGQVSIFNAIVPDNIGIVPRATLLCDVPHIEYALHHTTGVNNVGPSLVTGVLRGL